MNLSVCVTEDHPDLNTRTEYPKSVRSKKVSWWRS